MAYLIVADSKDQILDHARLEMAGRSAPPRKIAAPAAGCYSEPGWNGGRCEGGL